MAQDDTQHGAQAARQRAVQHELKRNVAVVVAQGLQGAGVDALLVDHAGHRGQRDKGGHQVKKHREHAGQRVDDLRDRAVGPVGVRSQGLAAAAHAKVGHGKFCQLGAGGFEVGLAVGDFLLGLGQGVVILGQAVVVLRFLLGQGGLGLGKLGDAVVVLAALLHQGLLSLFPGGQVLVVGRAAALVGGQAFVVGGHALVVLGLLGGEKGTRLVDLGLGGSKALLALLGRCCLLVVGYPASVQLFLGGEKSLLVSLEGGDAVLALRNTVLELGLHAVALGQGGLGLGVGGVGLDRGLVAGDGLLDLRKLRLQGVKLSLCGLIGLAGGLQLRGLLVVCRLVGVKRGLGLRQGSLAVGQLLGLLVVLGLSRGQGLIALVKGGLAIGQHGLGRHQGVLGFL